jgi:outer membrane murein-binding lipoprotein Lpp
VDLGDAGLALPLVLLAVIGGGLVLAGAVSRTWRQRRRVENAPAPATAPAVVRQESNSLEQRLSALHAAGRWDELLRLLDQTLPEWTVSSSLIEVARAVSALERDIAATHGNAVSDVVTTRLTHQAQTVADGLWALADRIVVADRVNSPLLRERLAREDEVLLRLLPAMREAQAGLAELVLAGSGGEGLRRAEGRFLALAATARELQEFGSGPAPS